MKDSSDSSQMCEQFQKARVHSPPPYEAKTAEKTKPKSSRALAKMKNLETAFEKINIAEIEARISTITAQKKQRNQQFEERSTISIAHFQLILQDNPQMVNKSIHYLLDLSNKYSLSQSFRKMFSIEKLKDQFSRRSPRSENLFKKSMYLLHNEVMALLGSYRDPQQGINNQFDVKLEIYAEFMKRYKDFHQYLPKQDSVVRKIEILNMLVSKKQLSKIKYFYSKCSDEIAYLGKQINIIDLVDTYYLFLLKRKFCMLKTSAKLTFDNRVQKLIQEQKAEFRKRKQLCEENRMKNEEIKEKKPFSELYRKFRKLQRQKYCRTDPQKLIEMVEVFEQMLKEKVEPTVKHPKIIFLSKERKISTTSTIIQRYNSFKKNQLFQQRWYGGDLSLLKRALIARYLKRNPQYTYEQILVKVFNRMNVYIEKNFYQENVVNILKKENQFQQFFYLNQIMEGIEKQQSVGAQIVFIDYHDVEREGEEELQFSMIAAVTLGGTIICKMYDTRMSKYFFLQEIATIFEKTTKQSVLVFFDRNFPYSNLLKENEATSLRNLHFLISLPSISVVPNPSQRLCKNIQLQIKAQCKKTENKGQSVVALFEKAVESYRSKEILTDIISKQWQKAKMFHIESQRFGGQSYKNTSNYDTPGKRYFAQIGSHKIQKKILKEEKEAEGEYMEIEQQWPLGQAEFEGQRSWRNEDLEFEEQLPLGQAEFEGQRSRRNDEIGRNKVQRRLFKEEKAAEEDIEIGQQLPLSSQNQQSAQNFCEEMQTPRQHSHFSQESDYKLPLMENLTQLNQEQYRKFLFSMTKLNSKSMKFFFIAHQQHGKKSLFD